jgi:N-acetylmuramoyl-L-alanine amidase
MLMAALGWYGGTAWGNPPDPPAATRGIIAIDPGHGGKQSGSRSPQGFLEKEICLALARQLALLLEPDFRVILTRGDDYDLPLTERTGIANHHRADLFISLHTAAGFVPAASGIIIYTYKPAAKGPGLDQEASTASEVAVWHLAQLPHSAASRDLALLFQQHFESMPGAPAARTAQGPLLVLAGAAMPAVLIEIGYLTHAATAERLNTPEGRLLYAQAMARAIDSFLAARRQTSRP